MSQRKRKEVIPSKNDSDNDVLAEYKKLNDLCDEILEKQRLRKNLTIRDSNDER